MAPLPPNCRRDEAIASSCISGNEQTCGGCAVRWSTICSRASAPGIGVTYNEQEHLNVASVGHEIYSGIDRIDRLPVARVMVSIPVKEVERGVVSVRYDVLGGRHPGRRYFSTCRDRGQAYPCPADQRRPEQYRHDPPDGHTAHPRRHLPASLAINSFMTPSPFTRFHGLVLDLPDSAFFRECLISPKPSVAVGWCGPVQGRPADFAVAAIAAQILRAGAGARTPANICCLRRA